jgi:hypothetical protein
MSNASPFKWRHFLAFTKAGEDLGEFDNTHTDSS